MEAEQPAEDRGYYSLLGVSPEAGEDEIKRAFRQLATALHPDKAPEGAEQAGSLFADIQQAYEVLADPQRREVYDVYGLEGLSAGLEVAEPLKTREQLRKEWEKFQQQQASRALSLF